MNNDKNQPLLSVIVPVYNTEKFLRKCIDSIINQTYKDLEIIIVNDCSLENEDVIIHEYMEIDNRVKVIHHEENRGLFQARITGMEAANGEYFAFVDSDDSISIDYYRLLIKKAIETDSDMVIADFANEYEDGRQEYYNLDPIRLQDIMLAGEQVFKTFMKQHGLFFGWHTVWNKIYSIDLWEQGKKYLKDFAEETGHLVMAEDIAYSCVFWSLSKKVTNVHNVYYFYARHSGQSVTNATFEKFNRNIYNVQKVFGFFEKILKELNKYYLYENDFKQFKDIYNEFWTMNARSINEEDMDKALETVKKLFGGLKEVNPEHHLFYKFATNFAEQFSWFEDIKKNICNLNTKYVSFDIFDTLIVRPFWEPKDIFYLLNEDFNSLVKSQTYIDFAKIRTESEISARKRLRLEHSSVEEITLEDIYNIIEVDYAINGDIASRIKEKEILLETEFCKVRGVGKELYDLAVSEKKNIIFTSDMYLPSEAVAGILSKNGYDINHPMFLSSVEGLTKSTGELFDLIIRKLKIQPHNITHIGDNWESDLVIPQKIGICCYYLPKTTFQFAGGNPGIFSGESFYKIFKPSGKIYNGEKALSFFGIRCMLAVIANKIFDNPYIQPFRHDSDFNINPFYLGYYVLGMHLYAVADWLYGDAVRENNYERIHFVSRDGYLPQKAFEILLNCRGGNTKTNYLHISRKSTLPLQCGSEVDMLSFFSSLDDITSYSPEKIMRMINPILKGVSEEERVKTLKLNKIVYSKGFRDGNELIKFIRILSKQFIDKNKFEKYQKNIKTYFGKEVKENDILFDMGYSARKEYLLSSVLKHSVNAYYIHIADGMSMLRPRAGNFKIKSFYGYIPTIYAALRELLFSKQQPSCIGYDYCINSSSIMPIFENYDFSYANNFIVQTIQSAALSFVRDIEKTFNKYQSCFNYLKFDASAPYEYFMHYSKPADRDMFSAVQFEDDLFEGGKYSLIDMWNRHMEYHRLNPIIVTEEKIVEISVEVEKIVEVPVEVKVPLKYEEFLEGKSKWKKALFMWLFDKKLFTANIKKRFRKK